MERASLPCKAGRLTRLAGGPPRPIAEAALGHIGRLVDVAEVHHDRRFQQFLHPVEVDGAELVPFRDENHRIGAVDGVVGPIAELDLGEHLARPRASIPDRRP